MKQNQEIEIPEGCEAKIVGNKVVFVPKESEDEMIRKKLIRYFNCYYDKYSCRTWAGLEVKKLLAYFEKQKPLSTEETELNSIAFLEQLGYTCVPPGAEQKPAEWSEEDEEHINSILERLEGMCKKGATFTPTRFAVSEDEDWLKSLRPQPHWKPSEYQMIALHSLVLDGGITYVSQLSYFKSLYEDLKKL